MGRVGFFHGFNRPRDVYPSRGRSNFNPPFDPVTALSHIEIVIDFAEYTSLARSPFHLGLVVGRMQQRQGGIARNASFCCEALTDPLVSRYRVPSLGWNV